MKDLVVPIAAMFISIAIIVIMAIVSGVLGRTDPEITLICATLYITIYNIVDQRFKQQ
jgi:hypothetical protein